MSELVDKQRAAVAEMGDTFSPKRDHHVHPPHLAHHFETPEQQFNSGKLGMWIFLGTELLMFGGLFCAYGVYRYNHPEVFTGVAEEYLNKMLGALNTIILIASSFTMAWAVRAAQLGRKNQLVVLLGLTLLGGLGFMVIKAIEYTEKYQHHVWVGSANVYHKNYRGPELEHEPPANQPVPSATLSAKEATGQPFGDPAAQGTTAVGGGGQAMEARRPTAHDPQARGPGMDQPQALRSVGPPQVDPNAGTSDEALIKPPQVIPAGLSPEVEGQHRRAVALERLPEFDRSRIASFFNIYYLMTGLHGLHVLIGMGLIGWIMLRAIRAEFGPSYFTPVDLVGLYWHLVDLIWIFLFPLLYLIH